MAQGNVVPSGPPNLNGNSDGCANAVDESPEAGEGLGKGFARDGVFHLDNSDESGSSEYAIASINPIVGGLLASNGNDGFCCRRKPSGNFACGAVDIVINEDLLEPFCRFGPGPNWFLGAPTALGQGKL